MLIRRLVLLPALIITALLTSLVALSSPSYADVQCPPGTQPSGGYCLITVIDDPPPVEDPEKPTPPDDKGGIPVCTDGALEVPCVSSDGYWNGKCYEKVTDLSPDNPLWEGKDGGVFVICTYIVWCEKEGKATGCAFEVFSTPPYWRATPPGDTVQPRALANQAVTKMHFSAGDIGVTPLPGTGQFAVIGVPVWLWISNPGESTTGPITRSATAGSVTVTATGTLDRIEWKMGDGTTVTCKGGGTPFVAGQVGSASPDCGHTYGTTSAAQPGARFTVTATSYWTVTWSGGGESGTIPLNFSRSVQIGVGEIQTVVVG